MLRDRAGHILDGVKAGSRDAATLRLVGIGVDHAGLAAATEVLGPLRGSILEALRRRRGPLRHPGAVVAAAVRRVGRAAVGAAVLATRAVVARGVQIDVVLLVVVGHRLLQPPLRLLGMSEGDEQVDVGVLQLLPIVLARTTLLILLGVLVSLLERLVGGLAGGFLLRLSLLRGLLGLLDRLLRRFIVGLGLLLCLLLVRRLLLRLLLGVARGVGYLAALAHGDPAHRRFLHALGEAVDGVAAQACRLHYAAHLLQPRPDDLLADAVDRLLLAGAPLGLQPAAAAAPASTLAATVPGGVTAGGVLELLGAQPRFAENADR